MLKIDDRYFINTNSRSFVLLRDTGRQVSTNGIEKEVFKVVGYYATLKQALNGYCEQNLKEYIESHEINLSSVIAKIDSLKASLKKFDMPFEQNNIQKIQEIEDTEEAPLVDDLDNPIDELTYKKP